MTRQHQRYLLVLMLLMTGATAGAQQIGNSGMPGQAVERRPEQFEQGRRSRDDFLRDAQSLLETERVSQTTTTNVRERFQQLTAVVSLLIQSGGSPRSILTREEANTIEAGLRQGNAEQAAVQVHEAILKLKHMISDVREPSTDHDIGRSGAFGLNSQQSTKSMSYGGFGAVHEVISSPLQRLNIHYLAHKNSFANILKILNPAIDGVRRRLYVSGAKSTSIGVVDLDRDELINTFDIGMTGGYLLVDPSSGKLYMLEIGGANKIYRIDLGRQSAEEISSLPAGINPPLRQGPKAGAAKTYNGLTYTDTGYPFEAGYLQKENASYGVIEIKDRTNRQVGRIMHGPDALYFDIDRITGKLYATNTGDGSISVFNLNDHDKKVKDIDLGDSVDEVLLEPRSGNLYIRNRLGGSVIYCYHMKTGVLQTINNENAAGRQGIGMWPTGMVYDDGLLYVLSHYAGRIDVIDTATNTLKGRIPLHLSAKPRTDGISTLAMNRKNKILYAAFPELGELAVADAKTQHAITTVTIRDFDKRIVGPARILLAVDEDRDRVFAYLSEERRIQAYQGRNCTADIHASIDAGRIDRVLLFNAGKRVLYAGNRILDADTLQEIGSFSRGVKVVAFNNARNRVYLTEAIPLRPGRMVEKVYEFEGLSLKKEWTLSPILSIPSSFAFDFSGNRFYVGYFEEGVVEVFNLNAGETPNDAAQRYGGVPAAHTSGQIEQPRSGQHGGPANGAHGYCGDGICQPIEREKGVCPEDCK